MPCRQDGHPVLAHPRHPADARTAEEHVLGGLREGADDYITKPFNLDILLLRIQKLLQWTQSNHEKVRQDGGISIRNND